MTVSQSCFPHPCREIKLGFPSSMAKDLDMSYSLSSLKGVYTGDYIVTTIGDIKGDTRSLNYSSFIYIYRIYFVPYQTRFVLKRVLARFPWNVMLFVLLINFQAVWIKELYWELQTGNPKNIVGI